MSAAAPAVFRGSAGAGLAWLVFGVAWGAMYLPLYVWAAQGIWQTEEQGHGPLVLAVVVALFWKVRHGIQGAERRPAPWVGWPVFAAGLVAYAIGRTFDISVLAFGSQILVMAGALLLMQGGAGLKAAWFAVAYMAFLVPLPGMFVDAVTGPLKQWISVIVQHVLYAAGYPIANSGVILTIGQYQLMVADACSGLNSMFSLSALGTLFMYVMGRKSVVHNTIMLAAILPIAFFANIVRVILLVLLTYHFGDEAGQGFLHGAAGIMLMGVALLVFFVLDAVLASLLRLPSSPKAVAARGR
ncbi:MAG: exosortase B [Rhizobacter sp.]|nr:exosortase B [Rhizobacter sp.]